MEKEVGMEGRVYDGLRACGKVRGCEEQRRDQRKQGERRKGASLLQKNEKGKGSDRIRSQENPT
jgi:hypothetical protein